MWMNLKIDFLRCNHLSQTGRHGNGENKMWIIRVRGEIFKEARGINSFPSGHQGVVMSQRHVESTPGSRDDWLGL